MNAPPECHSEHQNDSFFILSQDVSSYIQSMDDSHTDQTDENNYQTLLKMGRNIKMRQSNCSFLFLSCMIVGYMIMMMMAVTIFVMK